jgi:hypothetical protein
MARTMQAIADIIKLAFSGSLLAGAVTFYPISHFEGQPLYCDQFLGGDLTYSLDTAKDWGIWIALDVSMYRSGRVNCGDKLMLWLEGQAPMEVTALDAGLFTNYFVAAWPTLKIIADMPEYWLTASTRGVLALPRRKQ